jgi:hypothetical protein
VFEKEGLAGCQNRATLAFRPRGRIDVVEIHRTGQSSSLADGAVTQAKETRDDPLF